MAAFTRLPPLPRHCPARNRFGHDRHHYCCSLTTSMRFAPAAPSALAVAAATLFAAGALHPTALPPAARRGASPAAGVALLTAVLLRPRRAKRSRDANLDPLRAIELPPVETTKQRNGSGNAQMQTVFSASRREWDASPSPKSVDTEAIEPETEESATSTTPASTVYSYSYRRSKRKKKKRGPSTEESQPSREDDPEVEGMGGTFSHMREEFLSQRDGESGIREKVESTRIREDAWEDAWEDEEDDDYVFQGPSHRVVEEPYVNYETDEKLPPRPISAAKLMRQVVRAPMWLLSEVVLPVVDVVALVWFDLKVCLLQMPERLSLEGEDRYFLPELKRKRRLVEEEEVEGLSDEELQIRQMQTVTKNVVKGVEGTVRKLFNDIL